MVFNPENIAKQIFELVADADVSAATSCMTRLRITLASGEKVDIGLLKQVEGVLGVVEVPGQIQIILGPGKVNQVYEYFLPMLELLPRSQVSLPKERQSQPLSLKEKIAKKNATPFKLFLKRLANIFIPLIPAFIGCGLLLGILNIITKSIPAETLGGVTFDKTTMGAVLKLIGNSIGFGLALFVGTNAAKEFAGTPILGGVLAALLTMPELSNITVFGEHAVPGRGGVVAVLLVAIFAAFLERKLRKIIPGALDLFLTPTLVLVISGSLAIFLLQPLGGLISDAITHGSKVALEHGGPIVGFILSAAFLPLVMTGLHQGLIPIHAELIKTTGSTVLLPILAMAGAGQVGAALAIWLKTTNHKLKHIIKSSILVGFLGVGEPLIYGVTLPLVKPFLAACLGGGLGGAFVATFKLGATGIGISGLPLALLINNGVLLYLCGIIISYLGGFIATLIIGFDDSVIE